MDIGRYLLLLIPRSGLGHSGIWPATQGNYTADCLSLRRGVVKALPEIRRVSNRPNPSFRRLQPVIPAPPTRHSGAFNPSFRRLQLVIPAPPTRHSGASRNLTFAPGQSARQTIQAVWTNPIGGMPQLLCAVSAPISRQIRQLIRTKTAAKALDSGLRRNDG